MSVTIWQRPISAGKETDFTTASAPIHPAPVNSSPTAVTPTKGRSFVKCPQIERVGFKAAQTGGCSQNSLEIDSDARKSEMAPRIKRRREIGIGKRDLDEHIAPRTELSEDSPNRDRKIGTPEIQLMKMKMHRIQFASIVKLIQMKLI
jgi:hypothetical protein